MRGALLFLRWTRAPTHLCEVHHAPLSERGDDAYMTPPVATEALLRHVKLPHRLWEPACGDGSGILDVLRAHGHEVIGSDLVDYGRSDCFSRRDFLFERKVPDGGRGNCHQSTLQISRAIHRARARSLSARGHAVAAGLLRIREALRDSRRPWTGADPLLPEAPAHDAPPRVGRPQGQQRNGVRMVPLGPQPVGSTTIQRISWERS